ncbi:MAG: carboxypeptidase regulatory-like domain-containing protein [Planctomycetes bacterium]|nr:carboxypeptidase regulatory-like domain-containing protein [Planctomycetota bacterium]
MRGTVLPSFFLVAAVWPGALFAQNLLANPGFETGGGAPAGWSTWPPAPPGVAYVWSSFAPCSGSRCVEISAATTSLGMWRQELPVTGGALYTYSGWIETESIASGGECTLQAVFRNSSNAILEFVDLGSHDGTITPWMFDFPHVKRVRAPQGAVKVEVNLYLQGPGKARFDDVFFGPCETGTIFGHASNGAGPIAGAEIELWGTDSKVYSDANGLFLVPGVPDASPRWNLIVRAPGYRDATLGGVDVAAGESAQVCVVLRPGTNPADTNICLRAGRLHHAAQSAPATVDPTAVIDPSIYPSHVLPFLASDPYIDSDSLEVQAVAQEILAGVPPSQATNLQAVSHAAYLWIARNIEYDVVYSTQNYIDPTSGMWQTISGEGWCWGRNFTDWLYTPSEMLREKRGICIEHGRLGTAILRALGIPARPMVGHATMFWVEPPSGQGWWTAMSTSGGRAAYRDHGDTASAYGTLQPSALHHAALDAGPVIHSDWECARPGLWREIHPWGEGYPDTPAGQAQALADLAAFAASGSAPQGVPHAPGAAYEISYSDVTIDLRNVGRQRSLTARFPFAMTTAVVTDLGNHAWWSDHHECVTGTWITTESNSVESRNWLNLAVDLTPVLGLPEPETCDVKANGADEGITVTPGTWVTFTVSLDAAGVAPGPQDWWITIASPFGWFHAIGVNLWQYGAAPVYQGAAFDLPVEVPILDVPSLPAGTYTLFFSLDAADGVPQGTHTDSVSVTVEGP